MPRLPEPRNVIYGLYALDDPRHEIRYVGLSRRGMRLRFQEHLRAALDESEMSPVYRWMRKHVGLVEAVLLEDVGDTEALGEREIYWIAKHGTYRGRRGLNLTMGGEGGYGFIMPDEARVRMSEAAKARGTGHIKLADRLPAIQGEANWNSTLDDATATAIKQLIWEGEPISEIAEAVGVSRSAINHIKFNRAWTHVPWPIGPSRPARRSDRALRALTAPHSPERRAKTGAALKESLAHPETRAKKSANMTGSSNPQYGVRWSAERRAAHALSLSPLEVDDVREVRRAREEDGLTYKEIAMRIGKGVSQYTVGAIVRGEKFKDVA